MDRLYLVTRADLTPGQQAVQAAHALTEFLFEYPDLARRWSATSNTLALLAAPDEESLRKLKKRAFRKDLRASVFHEPDRGGEMTAIALEPAAKGLVRDLPLALV